MKSLDRIAGTEPNNGAAYADAVIDRLINKARGILPFNAFVLALIALVEKADKVSKFNFVLGLSALMLAASSLILLYEIFLPDFETVAHGQPFKNGFDTTAAFIRKRIKVLRHSAFLSLMGFFLCCLSIAAPYFIHLFRDAYIYWIAA